MASNINYVRSIESYDDAKNRLNEEQREKFNTFIASLQTSYPDVVTIEGNNITIDLNDYIKNNKDKVYETEVTVIKTLIDEFCKANPKFSNTYKEAPAPKVVEVVEVEDGRRRKTKRSPSKKSIKSKRKY